MKRFLRGAAGTGKTTYAVSVLQGWLQAGVEPHQITVLLPQRTLARPYRQALAQSDAPNALDVQIVTFGGLAQRALTLFWSDLAPQVIPEWDGREPTYLTVETAQYYMAQFVEPVLQEGRFDAVSLDRPRLIAQTLNNLAAAVNNGITLDEVSERLKASWTGHSSRLAVYDAAIEVARNYRKYCLRHALLDFSLQIELFERVLLDNPHFIDYAREMYRYFIVENVEENFPVALDFIDNWIWNNLEDALFIFDEDAGYRVFLGASPAQAEQLSAKCDQVEQATQVLSQAPAMTNLVSALDSLLTQNIAPPLEVNPLDGLAHTFQRFYPQMVDWVVDGVRKLVESGVEPRQIVIVAPFLNDSLRFTLFNQLEAAQIPTVSNRPSRALRDEPIARAMLSMLKLIYGDDNLRPTHSEFAQMLVQFIAGCDPVRAELLTQVVYRKDGLGSFEVINDVMQSRITYVVGERYEALRQWIDRALADAPQTAPDHLISRLFEFVSSVGYGLHTTPEGGRIAAQLMESARHFRNVLETPDEQVEDWTTTARLYMQLVGDGVLAAYHASDMQAEEANAVFVAPAYTFLMRNRFVDYQFWVDVGSNAWVERLEQPLTHPYVLRRDYPMGAPWTDSKEVETQQQVMRKLVLGLLRRCNQKVFLAFTDLSEQGYEQRGALLKLFNRLLQHYTEDH